MPRALASLSFLSLALAATLSAQVPTGHFLVLTTRAGTGSALHQLDPVLGTIRSLRRFGADGGAPLACTFDPVARHAIVAVAVPGGSAIYRVDPASPFERFLALLPDPVIGLELGETCDLQVITGGQNGAIFEVARNGSTPTFRFATPHATAFGAQKRMPYLWVASAAPSLPPSITLVDPRVPSVLVPPTAIPGLAGRRITGVQDLPTGAIRQALTDDQGGIHLFEFLTTLRTLAVMPTLPAGATNSLMVEQNFSIDAVVVGDGRAPHVTRVPLFGAAPNAVRLAGPLPGGAVDLDLVENQAAIGFGADCGGAFGNRSFQAPAGGVGLLEVRSAPANLPAIAVIGGSEQTFSGGTLPVVLPGGCPLLVSPEIIVPIVADAAGVARLTFAVPAVLPRAFAVHAQWVFPVAGGLATSGALSVQTEP